MAPYGAPNFFNSEVFSLVGFRYWILVGFHKNWNWNFLDSWMLDQKLTVIVYQSISDVKVYPNFILYKRKNAPF
jgi:hypothetical protein